MAKIEANDGDKVSVTVKDAWIENVHTREGGEKIVVKIKGIDEKGGEGVATLWMSDERRPNQELSEVENNLNKLEALGLENGDIRNLVDIFEAEATFYVRVKDGKVTYYLDNKPAERLDVNTAFELIEAIRGKAAAAAAALNGEPVSGDENMPW